MIILKDYIFKCIYNLNPNHTKNYISINTYPVSDFSWRDYHDTIFSKISYTYSSEYSNHTTGFRTFTFLL
jgi:hypothetical protein